MVFGFDNRVLPSYVSTVTLYSFTADAGFGADNVKYDDPWLLLKTSTAPTANPVVEITFSVAQTIAVAGIANHSVATAGYSYLSISYWNGSAWTATGGNASLSSTYGDPDILLRLPSPVTTTGIRFTLVKTSGWQPFRIGLFFCGSSYQVAKNPIDGSAFFAGEADLRITKTAGGAFYSSPPPAAIHAKAEISFQRVSQAQANVVTERIYRGNRGHVIAVIPPEAVSYEVPPGISHFYGYLTRVSTAPRSGVSAATHTYDQTLELEGAA